MQKHTAQRYSWFLESKIQDLKPEIHQATHRYTMNTYLPSIMSYAKLMVCYPRLHIVVVALKGKKKKTSYNASVWTNRLSQELCHDYDNAGMGNDLSCCRARPHLLQLSAATLQICYSSKMEKSSPSRHSSCQQGLAESRLGRHAMDEMLILACLTPEETGLHTNHVVQDTGSGCREDGSFAEHPRIFSLSKEMSYQSPVFLYISSLFAPLSPFFQYAFFFSLTSCSTLSFSPSFLCSLKTINYVRTAMLLETNGPSSWVFCLQQWLWRAE